MKLNRVYLFKYVQFNNSTIYITDSKITQKKNNFIAEQTFLTSFSIVYLLQLYLSVILKLIHHTFNNTGSKKELQIMQKGERGGSVVECRTPEPEVGGSMPTAAVLCP